ncbi:hypothetical protein [Tessaracoccus lapidicaptus]|uniref:hypothetical protein n=1 Tax=Tessaracoccus lapidicaptus TaxID=1427523 RepID=UPI00333FDD2D
MHEETRQIVRTSTGALVSEVGQDGTRVGVLDVTVGEDGVADWSYTLHRVDDSLEPDPDMAALIDDIRRPCRSAPRSRATSRGAASRTSHRRSSCRRRSRPPRTATPRSSRSAAGRDTPHTSAVPRPCTARYDALR